MPIHDWTRAPRRLRTPAWGCWSRRPKVRFTARTENEFLRRKKSTIAIRHVSGHRVVAVMEGISPGNKHSEAAFKALIDKAAELLEQRSTC